MANPLPHVATDSLVYRDGELTVGDHSITDCVTAAGRTPFYIYDSARIRARVEHLRATLPAEISLHYAMKANPMPEVVRFTAELVDGLDVASARELKTALTSCHGGGDISFAGPGKTDAELLEAVDAGITVNVESEGELARLIAIGQDRGRTPDVAIRVNPDFELKTSGMKMGGGPKQFGIDAERVPEVLRGLAGAPARFRGFHIYSGSQNLRPEAIIEAQDKTLELAVRLSRDAPSAVNLLNIGGGFGIPYFPGEQELDLAPVGANLAARLPEARAALPQAEFVIELGRYIAGPCGYYVCEVIDRKISRDHVFLITNGGLHHHLAASGNFGQVIRKNYPVVAARAAAGMDGETETASVVGPLCTPLDLLADRMLLPRADIDDLVVVFQSGAYGYT
ncbi:MAG: pyridoxal-dependent decarboxylase, exosortase A system-associated, partial [Gammaproteobacteria bacterium]|nr:pyridoxal-dependent decarboxylase, exosortase A system-associated [Gammaproteobacteria bacterium]